jgi:hypothetical protein
LTELPAEAETGDALVEADTGAAGLEALEEAEEAAGEEEACLELGNFVGGELAPAGGNGGSRAKTVQEELNFGKRKVHFGGEADEEEAVEGFWGVAALVVEAVGGWEEADAFVVADSGRRETGLGGEITDFHCGVAPSDTTCRRVEFVLTQSTQRATEKRGDSGA